MLVFLSLKDEFYQLRVEQSIVLYDLFYHYEL